MIRKSDWNFVGLISLAMLIALAFFTAVSAAYEYDDGLPYLSVINIIFDVVGMCVCIILFATTLLDHRMNMSTIYFMALLALEALLLFWDFEAWVVDSDPYRITFNKLMNYYLNGFILLIVITFWLYLKQILNIDRHLLRKYDVFFYVMFAIGMVILLSNTFTGFIFKVDPDTGTYYRGDLYEIHLVVPLVLSIACTFVAHRYIDGSRKKMGIYSYAALPIFAMVVQVLYPGLAVIYVAILFSLVLIYGNFYVERGQELIRMDAELVEKKTAILISQIQPRFLFNALNSIQNIENNPPETRQAIADFKKYMRRNFETMKETESIPFEKEMEHVETYVNLEKLRFKEKLTVKYDINDTGFDIPALTLQMLVENAIKHGVTQKETGGTVSVHTSEDSDFHIITVTDDGVGFDTNLPPKDEHRSHVGLENVKQRIRELVNGTLTIESRIGVGTKATVVIPKQNNSKTTR